MAVTVYFWPPHPGWGDDFNWGHAAVRIDGGIPPGNVYFSVWAKGEMHPIWGPGAIMPYSADLKAENYRLPHTERYTKLNETKMKDWIKTEDLSYGPFLRNCASNAASCLRAGTMFGSSTFVRGLTRVSINTPWALWLWIHQELGSYK